MALKGSDFQGKFSNLLNQTSKVLYQVGDTFREQAVKSRDLVEEKLKERELNQLFRELGKEVFALYAAGRIELPERVMPQIDRIKNLVEEIANEPKKEEAQASDAPKEEVKEAAPSEEADEAPSKDPEAEVVEAEVVDE